MDVWLITGIPGAGKSTVSRLLARRFPRAAHVEGDKVGEMVVSGIVYPGDEPQDESLRQIHLTGRNLCLLARSFAESGFVPVLDYVVTTRSGVERYRHQLAPLDMHLVVLHPGKEAALQRDRDRPEKTVAAPFLDLEDQMVRDLTGLGLWIGSAGLTADQTVDRILRDRAAARL
jgi:adenylylsulfate kinase-like enzyme